MRRVFPGGPLARRFAALALAIALPIWVICLVLLGLTQGAIQAQAEADLHRNAELMTLRIEAWYRDQISDLEILALTPTLRNGTAAAQHQLIHEVTALHPGWRGIGMVGPRGQLIMVSHRPLGTPLPTLGDLPEVRRCLQTGRPGITGVYRSRIEQFQGVLLVVPLWREAPARGAMVTVLSLPALARILGEAAPEILVPGLPGNAQPVVYVLAPDARLIYRSLAPDLWAGRRVPELAGRLEHPVGREHLVETRGADGIERLYAVQLSPATGWRIAVGLPETSLGLMHMRLAGAASLLAALATLATIALALGLALYFVRPIRGLRDAAIALGAGHLDTRVPTQGNDELADLGRAFNHMAEQLRKGQLNLEAQVTERTHDLGAANRDLEEAVAQATLINRQLSGTIDELRRMDQQRAEFLNMVSHDLRIPLTSIMGYAELLEDAGPEGDLREYVHQIVQAGERMAQLLEQLLDFARVEAGQLKLDRRPLDLNDLLPETIRPFRVLADRKQLKLEVDLPEQLPTLEADESRLQQVLSNLLSNAIKFTGPGGRIAVRARSTGESIRIEIEDSGIGIPSQELPKLFQRFFRASNASESGTGLGLAIARGIVEAHGGRIGVESVQGQGSIFWFELPLQDQSRQEVPVITSNAA